jgi:hypothetical protein
MIVLGSIYTFLRVLPLLFKKYWFNFAYGRIVSIWRSCLLRVVSIGKVLVGHYCQITYRNVKMLKGVLTKCKTE